MECEECGIRKKKRKKVDTPGGARKDGEIEGGDGMKADGIDDDEKTGTVAHGSCSPTRSTAVCWPLNYLNDGTGL